MTGRDVALKVKEIIAPVMHENDFDISRNPGETDSQLVMRHLETIQSVVEEISTALKKCDAFVDGVILATDK